MSFHIFSRLSCGRLWYNRAMQSDFEYIGLGFVSNDHLAVLPFIPVDTKVRMLSHAILGGGPAGNATAAAAALGRSAAFIGTVGDDADGRMILADFARQGVDTSMTVVRTGATSAIAYLWIDAKTGARSCAWTREGLTELAAGEITPAIAAAIGRAKILHLDGHNAAGAIAAAKVAKAAGVTVMYDAGTIRDGMEELLALADLVICSGEFVVSVAAGRDRLVTTGYTEDEVEAAVRALYAKYRPAVLGATMGVGGSMCFDGAQLVKCPAFPVEKVVDTTGCGDLFHTGFAVRWLETHDLLACQRFGAAVAAIKCRGLSGRPPSAPARAEVDAFLLQHQ